MTDKPAFNIDDIELKNITVTQEMIDAGLEELYSFSPSEPYEDTMREAVQAVYKVMEVIRLKASVATQKSQ